MARFRMLHYSPFMLAGAALFFLGIYDGHGDDGALTRHLYQSRGEIILGICIFLAPFYMQMRFRSLIGFSSAMREASRAMLDIESIRREHQKSRMILEDLHNGLRSVIDQFEVQHQKAVANVDLLLRRASGEQEMGLRQELGNVVREQGKWMECCVDYMRDIEQILSHDGLDAKWSEACRKSLSTFLLRFRRFALEIIDPPENEPFDENFHIVVGQDASADLMPGHVSKCAEWGFRLGQQVLQKAKVTVACRPESALEPEPITSETSNHSE